LAVACSAWSSDGALLLRSLHLSPCLSLPVSVCVAAAAAAAAPLAVASYTRSVLEHRKQLRLEHPSGSLTQVDDTPEMIVQRNQTLNEIGLREMRLGHVRAAWSIFNDIVLSDAHLSERDAKYAQTPAYLLNRGDSQREAGNWPQVGLRVFACPHVSVCVCVSMCVRAWGWHSRGRGVSLCFSSLCFFFSVFLCLSLPVSPRLFSLCLSLSLCLCLYLSLSLCVCVCVCARASVFCANTLSVSTRVGRW
jgi:hypothetical protein